eukprot:gene18919-25481_t
MGRQHGVRRKVWMDTSMGLKGRTTGRQEDRTSRQKDRTGGLEDRTGGQDDDWRTGQAARKSGVWMQKNTSVSLQGACILWDSKGACSDVLSLDSQMPDPPALHPRAQNASAAPKVESRTLRIQNKASAGPTREAPQSCEGEQQTEQGLLETMWKAVDLCDACVSSRLGRRLGAEAQCGSQLSHLAAVERHALQQ